MPLFSVFITPVLRPADGTISVISSLLILMWVEYAPLSANRWYSLRNMLCYGLRYSMHLNFSHKNNFGIRADLQKMFSLHLSYYPFVRAAILFATVSASLAIRRSVPPAVTVKPQKKRPG